MEPPTLKLTPVDIDYCLVCTLATEYCNFSPLHAPSKTPAPAQSPTPVTTDPLDPANPPKTEPATDAKPAGTEESPAPTANKKVKVKPPSKLKVLLQDKKGRTLTTVSGFDTFEISAKDICKKITKRFGCGAGSVSTDGFELQGAFDDQLVEFLTEEFPGKITQAQIDIENKLEKKHKKKGKPEAPAPK